MTHAEQPQQPESLTVDEALQKGIACHQAGQLQEAERHYRAILQVQSHHADANHNLGVVAVQVNRAEAGLPHFKAALEANPNQGQYWLSYIDALIQAGQTEVAREVLEQGRQHGLEGEVATSLAARLKAPVELSQTTNLPATQSIRKKKSKAKATKSDKPAKKPFSFPEKGPSTRQINKLVTLFNEGRYLEALAHAQAMTSCFPDNSFAWKVLGVLFNQMGRSADAIASLERAVAVSPGDAQVHLNLGLTLHDLGRLDAAETSYRNALQIMPGDAEVLCGLGHTLHKLGRLDEAENSYRRVLETRPDIAEAHSNLAITLAAQHRLIEAEASCRRALEIRPDYANAHNNLGNILKELNRQSDAEACFRLAIKIKPNFAEAHNNLGNVLKEAGFSADAEACYRQALAAKPDYVAAYYNLGITLVDQGRLDEAENSYRNALQIEPGCVDALDNLAVLLNAKGKPVLALNVAKQSLQAKETIEAKILFADCVKRVRWTRDDSEIRVAMVRALTEPWTRPKDLAQAVCSFVKLNQDIGECVARAVDAWPVRLPGQVLFGSNRVEEVVTDPLLFALLGSAPVCDIEIERFLTMARHAMLEVVSGLTASGGKFGKAIDFYSMLARQCFINEYVFAFTDEEIRKASDLRDSLVAALEAESRLLDLSHLVVAVASYFPLCSLPNAFRLLVAQWPDAVAALLVQQVREPLEEMQLRATIPGLTEIEDKVSLQVQDQYEQNPYPRWVKAAPAAKAQNIVEYLCRKFPTVFFDRRSKNVSMDILIAGCGTGQHSIETARRNSGAQVLAVDLSLSSLAYAKRKTRELGLTSIQYAQGDLLKLGSLARSFDLIESVGVLHHLDDPLAGWRVLLSLLRPGGFMKLGFYSEVARRNIVKVRASIAAQGYGATANEIRRCRQTLVDLSKKIDFGTTIESLDFFSMSSCRDLIFHVQEHRLTLKGIAEFLEENNLVFLGFDMEANTLHAFKQRFPDDPAATSLGKWQIFEEENPDTFFGMYQFWIQKPCGSM